MSQTIGKVRNSLSLSLSFFPHPSDLIVRVQTRLAYSRTWHHVSLSSPTTPSLGRLASRIAVLLMGKHKPIWDPSTDCGDYVIATGCNDVYVTGKKKQQKLYYKQTTRPGALRSINMEAMIKKWGGGEVLKRAVRGMLPKNRLRDPRLSRLKGKLQGSTISNFNYILEVISM